MNEVTKRLQERQKPKVKADQYVSLCIAKTTIGSYPVVLPLFKVSVGDLVWFPIESGTIRGEVLFFGNCTMDSDLWKGLVVAMQMEPIMAIKYATVSDVKWEE